MSSFSLHLRLLHFFYSLRSKSTHHAENENEMCVCVRRWKLFFVVTHIPNANVECISRRKLIIFHDYLHFLSVLPCASESASNEEITLSLSLAENLLLNSERPLFNHSGEEEVRLSYYLMSLSCLCSISLIPHDSSHQKKATVHTLPEFEM
jgi:hypothetical protein